MDDLYVWQRRCADADSTGHPDHDDHRTLRKLDGARTSCLRDVRTRVFCVQSALLGPAGRRGIFHSLCQCPNHGRRVRGRPSQSRCAGSNCEQCAAGDRVTGIPLGASRVLHDSACRSVVSDARAIYPGTSVIQSPAIRSAKSPQCEIARLGSGPQYRFIFYDVCVSGGGPAPEEPRDADEFSESAQ